MLGVLWPSVIILSVIMVSIFMMSASGMKLNVIMPSAVMPGAIMPRVNISHDRNPRFFKSLSRLKIFNTRLTPVISRLLTINTMLPTCQKCDRQYWNGQILFQIYWLSRGSIMPGQYAWFHFAMCLYAQCIYAKG